MKIQEFNYFVDLLQCILWQYNEAERIKQLASDKQEWYDTYQTQFWEDWYDNVFNLITANAFGLAIWSIILDIPLFIDLNPDPDDKPIFGFNEDPSINTYTNFENGNFSNRNSVVHLSVEEQRLVLRLRYYQLVSRGAIPEINQFLNVLFTTASEPYTGEVWALDGLNMTMRYIFNFDIPYQMRYILKTYDVLPRPAGVGIEYYAITDYIFGFGTDPATTIYTNFENGNFIPEFV